MFPIAFVIGVLVSLCLSFQFHENVQINWLVVLAAAIVLDVLLTWRHNRDEKRQKGEL
jgi:hypothetical protein